MNINVSNLLILMNYFINLYNESMNLAYSNYSCDSIIYLFIPSFI